MSRALLSLAKAFGDAMPKFSVLTGLLDILNGPHHPPKLCIDGREYRRRQRRRTKRNR